jgi:hypothetical protein
MGWTKKLSTTSTSKRHLCKNDFVVVKKAKKAKKAIKIVFDD